MKDVSYEELVTRLFGRLRNRLNLGLREYVAALDIVRGDFALADFDELKLTLQLLWCHSPAQNAQLEQVWTDVVEAATRKTKNAKQRDELESSAKSASTRSTDEAAAQRAEASLLEAAAQQRAAQAALQPLPLRPPLLPTGIEDMPELQTYWPISRRSMTYAWRYLRRPKPDGPADVLDIEQTVDLAAKAGFFLRPVYHRRQMNHAHLLLLIDQGGSMMPFHRFSRDLVETAQQESTLAQVDVYYFRNAPTTHVYQDPHLTQPVPLEALWPFCDAETSVLIFSDAGAARGAQRMIRLRETTEFLVQVQQRTALIGWLNPMPTERWEGSSAELIAYLAEMEQMDGDGFSNLIEVVRGQPLSSV